MTPGFGGVAGRPKPSIRMPFTRRRIARHISVGHVSALWLEKVSLTWETACTRRARYTSDTLPHFRSLYPTELLESPAVFA